MKTHLTLLAALLIAAPAFAETPNPASDVANVGIAADLGTTAIGLAMGFAEGNPLGLAVIPIKFLIKNQIDKIKNETERREMTAKFSAVQYGAAAANLCALAALQPAVAVLCLAGGMMFGYNQVKAIPISTDCVNRNMAQFQQAVATNRIYKVDLKTCIGRFEDLSVASLAVPPMDSAAMLLATAH